MKLAALTRSTVRKVPPSGDDRHPLAPAPLGAATPLVSISPQVRVVVNDDRLIEICRLHRVLLSFRRSPTIESTAKNALGQWADAYTWALRGLS
jgi:hypothetical protein